MSWLAAVLAVFAQCWRGWRFVEEATDMLGGSKGAVESTASQESVVSANPDIIIESADLLPGDVLLYRPRTANLIQSKIMRVTGSPYTHAAIYLGDGNIAESVIPRGVTKNVLKKSIDGTQCVAILRSQLGFGGERAAKLTEFVNSVIENQKFYDFISAICFEGKSKAYFDRQLEFIKENYGKISSDEEYSKMKFFCSAFVVACYTVVGIVGEAAQVAYVPDHFSPGHLGKDPTFGWLLGYLVPEDGAVPSDDPLLCQATLWRDCQDARWW